MHCDRLEQFQGFDFADDKLLAKTAKLCPSKICTKTVFALINIIMKSCEQRYINSNACTFKFKCTSNFGTVVVKLLIVI